MCLLVFFLHKVITKSTGTISTLSNQYCSTDPDELSQWWFCFRSMTSSGVNGCFNAMSLTNFYVMPCDDTICLKVQGLTSNLHEMVISVYCTSTNEQCSHNNTDINIFNFEIRNKGNDYWLIGTCHYYWDVEIFRSMWYVQCICNMWGETV